MKRLWLIFSKEFRLFFLRRKYRKAYYKEQALFDVYNCGASMIDAITGGELSEARLRMTNIRTVIEKELKELQELRKC